VNTMFITPTIGARRRRGCDCHDGKTVCSPTDSDDSGYVLNLVAVQRLRLCVHRQTSCKCRAAYMECDAELCKHAHVAKKKVGKSVKKARVKCGNFEMQRPSPVVRRLLLKTHTGSSTWTVVSRRKRRQVRPGGLCRTEYLKGHFLRWYVFYFPI
jgi:hypothetical protein